MSLQVVGAGVGRTGTYSLKLALEQLGLGPCHHMEEVVFDPLRQVPLWSEAVKGRPDWAAAYGGYGSAVDWPTAAFWREVATVFPQARIVLTVRDPEAWYESLSETIFKLLATRDQAPSDVGPFLEMAAGVVTRTGFSIHAGKDEIIETFNIHNALVAHSIPADRLLVYQVTDGWHPLCRFLGKPVPDIPFPNTNSTQEFWDRLNKAPEPE